MVHFASGVVVHVQNGYNNESIRLGRFRYPLWSSEQPASGTKWMGSLQGKG